MKTTNYGASTQGVNLRLVVGNVRQHLQPGQDDDLTAVLANNLLTTFVYDGDGRRLQMSVAGEVVTYTLDYARDGRVLLEEGGAFAKTKHYLYGLECIGELVDADEPDSEWRYYHQDGNHLVRQTTNIQATVTLAWAYSPEGAILLGEEGPVTHLGCEGNTTYDFSTGLIFKNGRYFDPNTGIWITLSGMVVYHTWQPYQDKRASGKGRKRWWLYLCLLLAFLLLAGCGGKVPTPTPTPCPPGPYDSGTPENSVQIRINIVPLHGVNTDWKKDVDLADRLFDRADVSVRAELKPPLNASESSAILNAQSAGKPDVLDVISFEASSLKTIEECMLITSPTFDCSGKQGDINNPSTYEEYLNPRFGDGRITMYYVPVMTLPGYGGLFGKAYRLADSDPPSFVVSAKAPSPSVTWAHELGHVLGLLHVNNSSNLMYGGGARSTGLTQEQLKTIYDYAVPYHGK